MSKDPAFLFYYTAFADGTKYMTDEEIGVYMRLLCEQADKFSITAKIFDRIVGDRQTLKDAVLEKFVLDEDGNYFNERLRTEQIKRKKYTTTRLKNFHKDSHMGVHMGDDMGGHTKDINKDINKDSSLVVSKRKEQILEYCKEQDYPISEGESFYDYYQALGWQTNAGMGIADWKAKMRTWHREQETRAKLNYGKSTGRTETQKDFKQSDDVQRMTKILLEKKNGKS